MKFNKAEILERCEEFFSLYDITRGRTRDMCELKKIHTRAVAENCVCIAKYRNLSEYDCDLAWVIGELHDFARFGQAVVTNTFRDSEMYNHARLGAGLLFQYGMIDDVISNFNELDATDKVVMKKAIYHHSDFHLPTDLTDRERLFCEIVREADQLDIFRTIVTSGWEAIYGHDKDKILASDISDGIAEAFPKHELADYSKRVTPADYHIAHIALCFGLKTSAARQRAVDQGYLRQMMDIKFYEPTVQEKYARLKKHVEEFFSDRIK